MALAWCSPRAAAWPVLVLVAALALAPPLGGGGGGVRGQDDPPVPAPDPNFVDEVLYGGFTRPTDWVVSPQGWVFVTEKHGALWVIVDGLVSLFVNLTDDVQDAGDRGLLSVGLDPSFAQNGYVYVGYTVSPIYGVEVADIHAPTFNRLVRYTSNGAVPPEADEESRTIILGTTAAQSGMPQCGSTHSFGKLRFAADGSLMFSVGAGSWYEFDDVGQEGCGTDATGDWDIGNYRSQSLDVLSGKIIRIDPATGNGLPGNPWYDAANPGSFQSRIWALGLRQPCRWSFAPTTDGSIVILQSDVGDATWEEDDVVHAGDNMLWPCYEGFWYRADFNAIQPAAFNGPPNYCANLDNIVGNPRWPIVVTHHTDPTLAWPFPGYIGNAATGMIMYTGSNYPAVWQNTIFYVDYGQSWIRTMWLNSSVLPYASRLWNGNADSAISPDMHPGLGNDVVYIQHWMGELHHIAYAPPVAFTAQASVAPQAQLAPAVFNFSSDGSVDGLGDVVAFMWDFGDGTGVCNEPNPQHAYAQPGSYSVTLALVDAQGPTASATVAVVASAAAPSVRITAPAAGASYTSGQAVAFASAAPAGTALSWDVQRLDNGAGGGTLHDAVQTSTQAGPTFTLVNVAGRSAYRVVLTGTDAASGAQASDSVVLVPAGVAAGQAPVAAFGVTGGGGGGGGGAGLLSRALLSFDASASSDGDGDVLLFAWAFGDGASGSGEQTTHAYAAAGSYVVTLTVSDALGGQASASQTLAVGAAKTPASTFDVLLRAYYALDEGSGTTVSDSTGQSAAGTLEGGATWVAGGGRTGGAALSLDGVTGYVTIADNGALEWAAQELSVSCWVQVPTTSNSAVYQRLFSKKAEWDSPTGWELQWAPSQQQLGFIATSTSVVTSNDVTLATGTWHHVAVSASGAEATIFVDGVNVTADPTCTAIVANQLPLAIGAMSDGQSAFFLGSVADVRIYSRALSAADVAALLLHGDTDASECGVAVFGATTSTSASTTKGSTTDVGQVDTTGPGESGAAATVALGASNALLLALAPFAAVYYLLRA